MTLHRRSLSDSAASYDVKIMSRSGCLQCGGATIQSPAAISMMNTLFDTVITAEASDPTLLEHNLLNSLMKTALDSSSSYARPSLTSLRHLGHYIAALDLVIKARRECLNSKKIAKFWKKHAIKANILDVTDASLTPSPSDLSETGLHSDLPPARAQKLKAFMKLRSVESLDICTSDPASLNPLESSPLRCHVSQGVAGQAQENSPHRQTLPSSDENTSFETSLNNNDRTLVEGLFHESTNLPDKNFILADRKTGPNGNKDKVSARLKGFMDSTHHPIGKVLSSQNNAQAVPIINTSVKANVNSAPGCIISKTPFTSVQNKRNIYESLASASKSPPRSQSGARNTSMLPISSARKGSTIVSSPVTAGKNMCTW